MMTALEAVALKGEVLSMENGVETVIGSGGVRLPEDRHSGWRWQEYWLIRALC